MYGDTDVVRALARGLRERGAQIRAEAGDLLARAEAVPWSGLAADAMRRMARDHAAGLRRCAGEHEAAADALDRHAREVEHLEELIATIEQRARHLLEGAAGGLVGLADHWLHHFDPPPHGSRAWLDVHLPRCA